MNFLGLRRNASSSQIINLAMRIERERFLGANHYERSPERRDYARVIRMAADDTNVASRPRSDLRLEQPAVQRAGAFA